MNKSIKIFQFFSSNFFTKNRKGVSEVVVGLFLILLAFVSVAIVSLVISNIIQTESEKVSLKSFFVDLDLQSVKTLEDGGISINVKRNPGEGDLTGIKFIFSDGTNTKVLEKEANLNELEQGTYTFSSEELGGINAKDVSIAPVMGKTSGKVETKNIIETQSFPEISSGNENVIVINFATISKEENSGILG